MNLHKILQWREEKNLLWKILYKKHGGVSIMLSVNKCKMMSGQCRNPLQWITLLISPSWSHRMTLSHVFLNICTFFTSSALLFKLCVVYISLSSVCHMFAYVLYRIFLALGLVFVCSTDDPCLYFVWFICVFFNNNPPALASDSKPKKPDTKSAQRMWKKRKKVSRIFQTFLFLVITSKFFIFVLYLQESDFCTHLHYIKSVIIVD